jgi:DNA-binding NarL/FixJ family response regulator
MTTADALVSEPLRVLIADDHVLFRDGLRALLRSAAGTQLVGEATTGEEAIRLAAEIQPDVILMDIRMPGIDGIEATRQIVRTSPHIGIVMVTMLEEDHAVFAAMRAGARGYLLKGADHEEMLRAIRVVGSGEAIFSASIAVRLMDYFAQLRPLVAPQILPELSNREREILELVAQGWKNAEIATHLNLTLKTVRNHISNILSKLQVTDRTQAALRAKQAGLG